MLTVIGLNLEVTKLRLLSGVKQIHGAFPRVLQSTVHGDVVFGFRYLRMVEIVVESSDKLLLAGLKAEGSDLTEPSSYKNT